MIKYLYYLFQYTIKDHVSNYIYYKINGKIKILKIIYRTSY